MQPNLFLQAPMGGGHKVETVFHHSPNDCEMRRVPLLNVGVGAINFTVFYTIVKIMHPGEKPIVCLQSLYCITQQECNYSGNKIKHLIIICFCF